MDNGGTSVDNYTITVTGPNMQELTSNGTTATITVVYNEMYTVNIRTNNCAGSSSDNAAADILEGKDQIFPPSCMSVIVVMGIPTTHNV